MSDTSHLMMRPGTITTLQEFLVKTGDLNFLSIEERQLIVDQALVLIEQIYVHLPLKRAMYAVDPVQRLKLLRKRLSPMSELRFHNEMISVFNGLHDRHTSYLLPEPFQSMTAFLPFLIEEFWDGDTRRYIVSKTAEGLSDQFFKSGMLVTHWNGIPIERAVELNAERQAGSNEDARYARGLEAMTVRPMSMSPPPDEEWIIIGYMSEGQNREVRFEWQVFQPEPSPQGVNPKSAVDPAARALGIDHKTEISRRTRKTLFVPESVRIEKQGLALGSTELADKSIMPDVFSFRTVNTPYGSFGYIRIWTFNISDANEFIREFVRIAATLPQNGLIIDVRGNGGGLLPAAECLLQVLTPKIINPEPFQFISSPVTLALCEGIDSYSQWVPSLKQSIETGAPFSQGFPINPIEEYNRIGQKYMGPTILIVDALCYSATDAFAAGFRDHGIGPILGASGNTGAGGANVWTHEHLKQIFPTRNSPFQTLPRNASFQISIRRSTRVGDNSGTVVEDLGIIPDQIHRMTKDDIMNGNKDLIDHAAKILASLPVRALSAKVEARGEGKVSISVTTKNISRLDVFLEGRPRLTLDISNEITTFELPVPLTGSHTMELRGFDRDQLVSVTRIDL